MSVDSLEFDENFKIGNPMFNLYSAYFKVMKYHGILQFDLNKEQATLTLVQSKWWKLLNYFNWIYMIIFCIKPTFLFYLNKSTNYENEIIRGGYIFQLIWMFGYYTIFPIFMTFFYYMNSIKSTIAMWLKLEKKAGELISESDENIKRRYRFLRRQQLLYVVAWSGSLLCLIPIAIFVPRFPPFANSIYMDHPKVVNSTRTLTQRIIEVIYAILDMYTTILAWGLLSGCDILVSMICRSLYGIIERLQAEFKARNNRNESGKISTEIILLYRSCQTLATQFNRVFARLLFFQEFTNLLLSVCMVYGALSGEGYLSLFCFCNTFPLTLRMYVLYLPMAKLYIKSRRFTNIIKTHTKHRVNTTSQIWKKLDRPVGKSFKLIALKAWFFHKISPTSILDYTLALLSYLVTMKQINN